MVERAVEARTRGWRWRLPLGAGLVAAMAVGGVAAASGQRPVPAVPAPERAASVSVDPGEIRSGDEDHFDHDEPPPATPPGPFEAGRSTMGDASPWTGRWGPQIEPLAAYEPQQRCLPGARPAVAAFARLLERTYPQGRDLGTSRACDIGGRSEHKEGRAHDWGVLVTVPSERMAAEELLAWLLATDEHGNRYAMARRLGVMYAIWDGHIWSSFAADQGWRVYRGPSPHTDHVHLSFSWDGALGRTSFWDGVRNGSWLPGALDVEALPSTLHLGRIWYRAELGERPGAVRRWGDPSPAPSEPAATRHDVAPEESASPPERDEGATATPPASSPGPVPEVGDIDGGSLGEAIEPLPVPVPVPRVPTVTLPSTTVPPLAEVTEPVVDAAEDLLAP